MTTDKKALVLTVDDDPDLAALIGLKVRRWGFESSSVGSAVELWTFLEKRTPDLVLMDLMLGDENGALLMSQVKARFPEIPVIMITRSQSVESAVESMRSGANDYITKPLDFDHLREVVSRELTPRTSSEDHRGFGGIIGRSEPMLELYRRIENMAPTDVSALILGETGTGKELVARVIHDASTRRHGPFIALNAAAIPHDLIESQLFGHERGAFTGAERAHTGYCEQADGGTLFLDEIGEMSIAAQAKLLRFLEDHTVQRIGSRAPRKVDVRVLAATHVEVNRQIAERRLRPDLYYRLKVVLLRIPPLRQRGEDIGRLAQHFLEGAAQRHQREFRTLAPEALDVLYQHRWEGNVRELKHAIEGAVVLHRGEVLTAAMLPEDLLAGGSVDERPASEPQPMDPRFLEEKRKIEEALRAARGIPEDAAQELGISRATIYRKIKKFGLPGRRPV